MTQKHVVKKRKVRRIRKSFIVGFIVVVIGIVCLFTVPKAIDDGKLSDLGYDKTDITAIRDAKLTKTILKTGYYSDYLAASIRDGSVNTDYLQLYAVSTIADPLDDSDFLLYNRLLDRGYTEDQAINLFKNLKFYEMTPLLVFDYQENEQPYIDDCLANRETNSTTNFVLNGDYYTHYDNSIPVPDITNVNMLVNKTYYLPSDYTPPQIAPLSIQIASSGLQLNSDAAAALDEWCGAGMDLGVRFYAVSAFRPYDRQQTLYDGYVSSMGKEQADALSARPGFSEHQTGYTVDLAAVGSEGLSKYVETDQYFWTSTNCQDYGWILRYPEGKQQITGYEFESWHYRYLGVDLAKSVVASGLTYDEYYCLYLKPWDNEEFAYQISSTPSQDNQETTEETETSAQPEASTTTE